jgi:iron complex transport system substrate-binding protein
MVLASLRRWIPLAAVILVSLAVLAACGQAGDGSGTDDPDAASTEGISDDAVEDSEPIPIDDGVDGETIDPAQTPEAGETPAASDPDDSGSSDAEGEEFPVTVTRSDGVELTLEERPQRIISLSPGATETFFAIGAGEQMIAVDMFSDYPPEALELDQVDAYQPDPEAIVDMAPDLVFVIFDADGIVAFLDDLDVPVLYLEAPDTIDDMLDQILLLGEVTGNVPQADELKSSLDERIQSVTERVGGIDLTPHVYHELDDSFFTVGPDSFIGDLYNLLGATNIAEGAPGEYPQLSEEIILEQNPNVIVIPAHGEMDGSLVEAVEARPGWDAIDAVQNERVYEIDGDIVSRPGPRIVDALEQLAEMLYPEEFVSHNDFTVTPGDLQTAA